MIIIISYLLVAVAAVVQTLSPTVTLESCLPLLVIPQHLAYGLDQLAHGTGFSNLPTVV